MSEELSNLEDLLDRIKNAEGKDGKVTIDNILDKVGRRTFAPLLLFAGIITVAPIVGDIPGVPTIMGIFVLLTTAQMLFRRDHFWLPEWILKRSMKKEKLEKGVKWMYKPARFIDRWSKPRWTTFTHGTGSYAIAAICLCIALVMPIMEVVPFSANAAGGAFTIFGLSLITHDGFLALIALIFALGTFSIVVFGIF